MERVCTRRAASPAAHYTLSLSPPPHLRPSGEHGLIHLNEAAAVNRPVAERCMDSGLGALPEARGEAPDDMESDHLQSKEAHVRFQDYQSIPNSDIGGVPLGPSPDLERWATGPEVNVIKYRSVDGFYECADPHEEFDSAHDSLDYTPIISTKYLQSDASRYISDAASHLMAGTLKAGSMSCSAATAPNFGGNGC